MSDATKRTLDERVASLEERISRLEASDAEIDYGAPYNTNEECRAHTCDYYGFYLAQGPAELTHQGYHAAERHLIAAVDAHDAWIKQNPGPAFPPAHIMSRLNRWEKAVRA